MPSSDYAGTIKGGLKLKGGAKDAGVKKKKKSSSSKKDKSLQVQGGEGSTSTGPEDEKRDPGREDEASGGDGLEGKGSDGEESSKALERRESSERAALTSPVMGMGKTETQLRHEEIRRKRVCHWIPLVFDKTIFGLLY